MAVGEDLEYRLRGKRVGIFRRGLVGDHRVSVPLTEAVLRAYPDEALVVLTDGVDGVAGSWLMFERWMKRMLRPATRGGASDSTPQIR